MIDSFPSTISQRVNVVDVAALARHTIHALINATSVGMSGGGAPDQSPVPLESLVPHSPNLLVMDAVYKPRRTPLLLRARELSLRTVGGVTLFVAQAQRQFQAWTGRSPPAGLFEQAADAALDPTQDYQ
jgi:shikimate dehydrogenase